MYLLASRGKWISTYWTPNITVAGETPKEGLNICKEHRPQGWGHYFTGGLCHGDTGEKRTSLYPTTATVAGYYAQEGL